MFLSGRSPSAGPASSPAPSSQMPRSRASAGPVELFKNFAPGRMGPLMAANRSWFLPLTRASRRCALGSGRQSNIAPWILAVTARATVSTVADEQMIAVRRAVPVAHQPDLLAISRSMLATAASKRGRPPTFEEWTWIVGGT